MQLKIKLPPFWHSYPTLEQAVPSKYKDDELGALIEYLGEDPESDDFNGQKKLKREWIYMKILSNEYHSSICMDDFRRRLLLAASAKKVTQITQESTPEAQELPMALPELIPLPPNTLNRNYADPSPFPAFYEKYPSQSSQTPTPPLEVSPAPDLSFIHRYLPQATPEMIIEEIHNFEVPEWCQSHQREMPFIGQVLIVVEEFMNEYLEQFKALNCFSKKSPKNFTEITVKSIILIDAHIHLYAIITETDSFPWQPRLISDSSESLLPISTYEIYRTEDIHIGCPGSLVYASDVSGSLESVVYKAACLSESREGHRKDFIYVAFVDQDDSFTSEFTKVPIWDFLPLGSAAYFPKTDKAPFLTTFDWNSLGFHFQKMLKETERDIETEFSLAPKHLRSCVAALSLHPAAIRYEELIGQLLSLLGKRHQKVTDFYEIVADECKSDMESYPSNSMEFICASSFLEYFKEILLPTYKWL